jgi:hypothetical protein
MPFEPMTFDELHEFASAAAIDAEPPDVQTGADAQLMVAVLCDWIAANVDEQGRTAVAQAIAEAFAPQAATALGDVPPEPS